MTPGDFLNQILAIIQDPTSNLTAAVLLVALVTLTVLIIIIGLLLAVTRAPSGGTRLAPRYEDEYEYPELSGGIDGDGAAEQAAKPRPKRKRLLSGRSGGWIAVALVLLSIASAYVVTSTDSYCLDACHTKAAGMDPKARAGHKDASCVSCHEDPAPLGIVGSASLRTGHLVQLAVPSIRAYAGSVPTGRCLGCHSDVLTKVVKTAGGAKMSHKEPIASGMSCRDCHGDLGHGGGTKRIGMSSCVRCHDSKTASSKCGSCHMGDTAHASAAAGASRGFPRIQLGPVRDCSGCHQQKTCDDCHGTRMPHPQQFMLYRHARDAAFERKKSCYRCHVEQDCGVCHSGFETHGPTWKKDHQASPRGAKCDCHWAKLPDAGKGPGGFCAVCH